MKEWFKRFRRINLILENRKLKSDIKHWQKASNRMCKMFIAEKDRAKKLEEQLLEKIAIEGREHEQRTAQKESD